MGFVKTSPTFGFSELNDLGTQISCDSLKSWGTRCVIHTLHFQVEAWCREFLLIIYHCARDKVYGKSMSQPFSTHFYVGVFSATQCIRVTQLVSVFLSEETSSHLAVYSLCACVE